MENPNSDQPFLHLSFSISFISFLSIVYCKSFLGKIKSSQACVDHQNVFGFVYLFSFIHATFLEISIIVTTLQGKLWFRGTKLQAQLQDPWDSHWCLFLVMLAPFRAHMGTFAFRGFPLWMLLNVRGASDILWASLGLAPFTRSLHSSYPLWVMSTSQRPRRKSTPG